MTTSLFGHTAMGAPVTRYVLRSVALEVELIDLGARVVAVHAPGRDGARANVVLGMGSVAEYERGKGYFGAVVGRYANRIAGGMFELEGETVWVPVNNGPNALHGGPEGFDQRLWHGREVEDGVEFTLVSVDGDQGFPGTLTATATYTLKGNELRVEYTATTDRTTVVNLTNHAYFNLAGAGKGTVLDHVAMIAAEAMTPVTETLTPTGELRPVAGTAFDFREARRVGERIDADDEQLKIAGGYDHNFAMGRAGEEKLAAVVEEPGTGRVLTVRTTEPGVQFYTGNFVDGTNCSPEGVAFERRSGFCLETQHYPDSVHHAGFPTTVLRAGETMRSWTTFEFSVKA